MFIEFYLNQTDDNWRKARYQMLQRVAVLQFVYFMHLRLRELRKNTRRWEQARQGLDGRIGKVMCSLEGVFAFEGI